MKRITLAGALAASLAAAVATSASAATVAGEHICHHSGYVTQLSAWGRASCAQAQRVTNWLTHHETEGPQPPVHDADRTAR